MQFLPLSFHYLIFLLPLSLFILCIPFFLLMFRACPLASDELFFQNAFRWLERKIDGKILISLHTFFCDITNNIYRHILQQIIRLHKKERKGERERKVSCRLNRANQLEVCFHFDGQWALIGVLAGRWQGRKRKPARTVNSALRTHLPAHSLAKLAHPHSRF